MKQFLLKTAAPFYFIPFFLAFPIVFEGKFSSVSVLCTTIWWTFLTMIAMISTGII